MSTDQASGLEVARQMINQKAEVAIITLADNGVCYASSEVNGHVPAIQTKVLDPTGAGDALTSAVIFGLMNDIPIDDAVRLGVSAASLVLRHPGTVLPDLSLERLYDQLVISNRRCAEFTLLFRLVPAGSQGPCSSGCRCWR